LSALAPGDAGPRRTTLVVPCYDEAARLDRAAFERFAKSRPDVGFVFVDDGSRDATAALLESLAAALPAQADVLRLERNAGKAEAVRRGVLRALERRPRHVGYWDADLATPLEALPELEALLDERAELLCVFGSRVRLLGRRIERRATRHYLGRVFATAASVVLRLPIYDTQCGAKLFRAGDETRALFAEPFVSGWIFDVELVARLIAARRAAGASAADAIHEHPLRVWRHVEGSKVRPSDFLRALRDLARIRRRYLARR
jgi:glycosyltransferase involved in cell wall biosynthesis